MPTAVLFNGGVFKAAPIRARVLDLLASWNGGQAVRELQGSSRISPSHRAPPSTGGTAPPAKACASRPARRAPTTSAWKPPCRRFPGSKPPVKALCVVPQGMQEGTELLIEGRDVRPCHRPGGGVPVLLLLRAKRRHAGTDPARCRT